MSDEIGRELTPAELQRKTVVCIAPPGHPDKIVTMWVIDIAERHVLFYSGVQRLAVICSIRDDLLYDDQDRLVRVFAYLGEV